MKYRAPPAEARKSALSAWVPGLRVANSTEMERTVEAATGADINHLDYVTTNDAPFEPMACAIGRCRDQVHLQVHLGANYRGHEYTWTTDPKTAIADLGARLAGTCASNAE